jgi:hypothetical protein
VRDLLLFFWGGENESAREKTRGNALNPKSAGHSSLAEEEWPRITRELPLLDLLFHQVRDDIRSALLAVPRIRPAQRICEDDRT